MYNGANEKETLLVCDIYSRHADGVEWVRSGYA